MELFDTLNGYGLTAKVLQFLILAGVVIYILGMYWRIIMAGSLIVFCMFVFASPNGLKASDVVKVDSPAVAKQKEIDLDRKGDFMEDCMHYGDTEEKCRDLWRERGELN
jgi:hypothetical protein